MSWNSTAHIGETYDSELKSTAKDREYRIFLTELLRDFGSTITVDEFIAFEKFLALATTDVKVEYEADRHRFPGSQVAYEAAIQKVALSDFDYPNASIAELLRIRTIKYAYSKNREFKARVRKIFEEGELRQKNGPVAVSGVSPALLELLSDIESMHIKELPEEDVTQYSLRDIWQRLTMWESLLFKNDPLYQRLKAAKTENIPRSSDANIPVN